MKRWFILCLFLSLLISACGKTHYSVKADSITAQDYSNNTKESYYVIPLDKNTRVDDLTFQSVVSLIKPYFEEKNMYITNDIVKADNIIILGYGISDPQILTETRSEPVTGIIGYNYNTYGNIYTNNNYGTYNSNTYSTPKYGIVGYREKQINYTIYSRWIGIAAYKKEKDKIGKQIWKTYLYSEGSSNDLRGVMPYIIKPLSEVLGTNTNGYSEYLVNVLYQGQDDEEVTFKKVK